MNFTNTTVVSSRIRLARNVKDMPFPHRCHDRLQSRSLAELVKDSLLPLKEQVRLYPMDEMRADVVASLKDNYLISNTLIKNKEFSYLIADPSGSISVMINEEDHIREQYMERGYVIRKLFERAMDIDENYIGKKISYAKSPRFGFLTACPTNLGTGMRASVMMFLPGIVRSGEFSALEKSVRAQGYTIRGNYGEGTRGEGYLFQISNEITLGVREEELISRLEEIVRFTSEQEVNCRYRMKETDVYALKDSCGRAYGILTNAEILPYDEFLRLVSEVKFGVTLGFYKMHDIRLIDDLIVAMRPYNLKIWNREELDDEEDEEEFSVGELKNKDIYRAQCVRKTMLRSVEKEK